MTDMRRRGPEPQPGPPRIQRAPGMAQQTLRELAPYLAEEGIDVDNIDVPDMATLQAALDRAVERQNQARFNPIGTPRDVALTTLRLVVDAIADDDTHRAAAIMETIQPEPPDETSASVAACIGVALHLLDEWLSGRDARVPGLGAAVRLPTGHWVGERAATDILVLARKGRAFASLDSLIARQGGKRVLYGAALALAAATIAWAKQTGTTVPDLTAIVLR